MSAHTRSSRSSKELLDPRSVERPANRRKPSEQQWAIFAAMAEASKVAEEKLK
jgi:hypothetical protein